MALNMCDAFVTARARNVVGTVFAATSPAPNSTAHHHVMYTLDNVSSGVPVTLRAR